MSWWRKQRDPIVVRPLARRKTKRLVGLAAAIALATPLVLHWEGTELRAYRDVVGVWTICSGETLGVQPGDTATAAECQSKLAKRLVQFGKEIAPCLPADLPVEMLEAFISAAYNIGSAGFCRSSMSRRALVGDLTGACDALLLWDKGRINGMLQVIRGLTRRREDERALCLDGAKST